MTECRGRSASERCVEASCAEVRSQLQVGFDIDYLDETSFDSVVGTSHRGQGQTAPPTPHTWGETRCSGPAQRRRVSRPGTGACSAALVATAVTSSPNLALASQAALSTEAPAGATGPAGARGEALSRGGTSARRRAIDPTKGGHGCQAVVPACWRFGDSAPRSRHIPASAAPPDSWAALGYRDGGAARRPAIPACMLRGQARMTRLPPDLGGRGGRFPAANVPIPTTRLGPPRVATIPESQRTAEVARIIGGLRAGVERQRNEQQAAPRRQL